MNIIASRNINESSVLLEYTSGKNHFRSPLSYTIPSDKADEFVSKYNTQSERLSKVCASVTVLGALTGWFSFSKKSKVFKPLINSAIGAFTGFILSSYTAYKLNNKLMDKYNVREYTA
jgi:hypothetical protein